MTHYPALTPREEEVRDLLVEGLSNRDIAARLGIGRGTVKTHAASILGKYGVANRTELTAVVLRDRYRAVAHG